MSIDVRGAGSGFVDPDAAMHWREDRELSGKLLVYAARQPLMRENTNYALVTVCVSLGVTVAMIVVMLGDDLLW